MDKAILNSICEDLKRGRYKQSYVCIAKNQPGPITGDTALNLLVLCSTGLQFSSSPDDLVKVVKSLTFGDLKGGQLTSYLQAMFYILKQLIGTHEFTLVLELGPYLSPQFLNNITTDQQGNFLKYLCSLLYNGVGNQIRDSKDFDIKVIRDLFYLLTQMVAHTSDLFLAKIDSYVKAMHYAVCDSADLCDYYIQVIETLKSNESLAPVGLASYMLLNTILKRICKILIEEKSYNVLCKIVLKSKSALLRLAGAKSSLLEQIFDVHKLFRTLDGYPEDSKTILEGVMSAMQLAHYELSLRFQVESIAELVINILYATVHSPKEVTTRVSDTITSSEFILAYYKFVRYLGKLVSHSTYKCCCGIDYDIYLRLKSLLLAGAITKLAMNSNSAKWLTNDVQLGLFDTYDECCRIIEVVKKADCIKFEAMWQSVGCSLYNISVNFYVMKDKSCLRYLTILINKTFHFEGVQNKLIIANVTNLALDMYAEQCYKTENYEVSLTIAAFNIYLYPASNSQAFNQWLRCKSALKEGVYKNLTMTQVLSKNKEIIKPLYPDFKPITDQKVIIKLLVKELAQYKKQWPCRVSMFAVYKELFKFARAETVSREIVCMPLDEILKLDHTIKTIVYKCIEHFEGKKVITSNEKITLGYLYYLYYKFAMVEAMEVNSNEMKSVSVPPKGQPIPQEEINVNDECDVMSTYANLQIDQHYKTFVYLHKSKKYLKECGSNELDREFLEEAGIANCLIELGHEYKLSCYDLEALEIWLLALRVVKLIEKVDLIVIVTALLIEHVKVGTDTFNVLLNDALKYSAKINDAIILCKFHIGLSFAYLKSDDLNECVDAYEKATEYYYQLDNDHRSNTVTVKVQYMLLQAHLSSLPCPCAVQNHDTSLIVRSHLAMKLIVSFIKLSNTLTPHFMGVMFEVTEYVLKTYYWMHLPREVRCYGREIIVLAQQLILPFRTARLLVYLAKADILNCKFDDCDVKLEGLSHILCLSGHKVRRKEISEPLEANDDVHELSHGLRDMVLEYPGTVQAKFLSCASPILFTDPFKLPSFVSHPNDCNCMPCSSSEYQDLVLQKIHLDASLSECRKDLSACSDFYKGFFDIYNHIKNNAFNIPKNISLNFTTFSSTYNSLMFDYVKYKARNKEINVAKELNTELIINLNNEANKNYHLYSGCLNLQRFLLDTSTVIPVQAQEDNYVHDGVNEPKTPETKVTRIKFKQVPSPNLGSPHTNGLIAVSLFNNDNSPTFCFPRTPAAKFKIYTPASNKARPSVTATSYRRKLEGDMYGTTDSSKKNAAAKAKKLPSKLKSTKKSAATPGLIVTDENSQLVESIGTIKSVRKNLMEQLSDSTEEVSVKKPTKITRSQRVRRGTNSAEVENIAGSSGVSTKRSNRRVPK